MKTDNIMEVKGLTYCYEDNIKALDNIDISIPKGKVTAILGKNGSGKSTLFLNLNGVLTPTVGSVFFKGEQVKRDKKSITELRRKVGVVFQDPNDQLFSSNVANDVAFGVFNLGLPKNEVELRVKEALAQVGMTDFAHKPVHALSFGQKKRVAVAGVLAMQPEVIILDEPTAGLDPEGISDILHLLIKIKEELGVTIIIATHEIDIVPVYCDKVYVLNGGGVVMSGTPEEVFSKTEDIRKYSLRLPRVAHLMEILNKRDGIGQEQSVLTISEARKAIRKLFIKEK